MTASRSGALSKSFDYTNNNTNQRTRITREDGTYWGIGFDGGPGHVTSSVQNRQLMIPPWPVGNSATIGMSFGNKTRYLQVVHLQFFLKVSKMPDMRPWI